MIIQKGMLNVETIVDETACTWKDLQYFLKMSLESGEIEEELVFSVNKLHKRGWFWIANQIKVRIQLFLQAESIIFYIWMLFLNSWSFLFNIILNQQFLE